MTDIRRTLLWGIFLASLFFLWEGWNRHNGQPSMFGPPPAARVATPSVPSAPVALLLTTLCRTRLDGPPTATPVSRTP